MSSFDEVLRTLLVTGSGVQQGMLGVALHLRSHQVTVCDSVETAWSEFRSQPFRLVILDYTVSRQQAQKFCLNLRGHSAGPHCFVLMVSLRAAPGELEAVLETGADDYVLKQGSVADICVRLAVAERLIARRAGRFPSPRVPQGCDQSATVTVAEAVNESHPLRGDRELKGPGSIYLRDWTNMRLCPVGRAFTSMASHCISCSAATTANHVFSAKTIT